MLTVESMDRNLLTSKVKYGFCCDSFHKMDIYTINICEQRKKKVCEHFVPVSSQLKMKNEKGCGEEV
jgi:hypothetical protein